MFTRRDIYELKTIDSFWKLSSDDFEWCCKFLLEEAGYGKVFVTRKGPRGGDGGVDLTIHSKDNRVVALVQCKLWKGRFNGLLKPIRELAGCMKRENIDRGIFVITTEISKSEQNEAREMDIEILDANDILELSRKYIFNHGDLSPFQKFLISKGATRLKRVLGWIGFIALEFIRILLTEFLSFLGYLFEADRPRRRRSRRRRYYNDWY